MLDVVVVKVTDAGSDFGTMDATAEAQQLAANFFVQVSVGLFGEEAIP
jgi:hypothetical protein